MKKALSYIVASIVSNPKEVEITEGTQDEIVNFTVKVSKDDMGRIIGKNGKVIKAIRNVIKINAIKQNKKINISLLENPA